ncbi:transcription antitermination protein NusB [Spiroplasma chrysopicola]|uniref:Transcription antitermination protein NusB n=1 Tax=Spiroplasma chrysopicola DF-1 TaxID=1276227 RepID=R4U196_9MOLU|nr:transcription antitermination factor NusB [Spiroplasma chrysopicola]AGM25107.1 transcription antitermination protein NusB [Spiroplasma chrysopicola DF-1]
MSKRKERLNAINLLYRHFVLNHDLTITRQEAFDFSQSITTIEESNNFDQLLEHFDEIIILINQNLAEDWNFERLSNFHKATLVYSTYEIKYLKVARAIIINEALEILKKYGELTELNYINKVLDQI